MCSRGRGLPWLAPTILSALVIAACSPMAAPASPSRPPTGGEALLVADVARAVPVDAPVADAVRGLSRFGHDLFDEIADPDENSVLSPLSIGIAFGMARAGAAGETARQIDEVFGFPAGVSQAFNALDQEIVSREGPPPMPDPSATRDPQHPQAPIVSIANALFAQQGLAVKQPFLEELAREYGAGVRVVDFTTPGAAKALIDAWVREQTAERIEQLFDELPPRTVLVLANAIYLKADWKVPFAEGPIEPARFTLADGREVQAVTMGRLAQMRYVEDDGWQAVELPYAGEDLAMWVIVPRGETSPVDVLAPDVLESIEDGLHEGIVDLSLPRWDFATDLDLGEVLPALGLREPFTSAADFSGMTDLDLYIEAAVHRANITVDEWGTEAAAVTGLAFPSSGPPAPDAVIHADHPFAFVIRHQATKTPLFIGQVADPTATR